MPEVGHFQRLRPLIADLSGNGFDPYAFTDRRFAPEVERAGGRFVDLFAGRPLAAADDESIPLPCRYVTFAAHYADDVIAEVKALAPSVVVYDTFAVIGPVVGRALGVPYVNLCAGHKVEPARVEALVANHPRIDVSDACREAVETLRLRHGIADASPFSYLTGVSLDLNLYCEPPEFLPEAQRSAFEPVAFYGSLPSRSDLEARSDRRPASPFPDVYACFGTVVWRYWAAEALEALRAVSAALAATPGAAGLISLGGAPLDPRARGSLEADNVTVADYVDQWEVLRGANVLITHQGLNSTHEAIYNRVPMLSYPFLFDQPDLARTCEQLGLAMPLVGTPREPVSLEDVSRALAALRDNRDSFGDRLADAREWELRVMADRPAVIARISALSEV
jgi:UDP:flavonoid glycosyltransferase YjiC (YdhE family)